MRRSPAGILSLALLTAALVMSGCGGGSASIETELTETYVFPGFNFSIDHRAGWRTETRGTTTHITELEADQGEGPVTGYMVHLMHQPAGPMFQGVEEAPTLEDLLEANIRFFQWEEPLEALDTEVFGVPALRSTTEEQYGWADIVVGFAGGRAFLLALLAPSSDALSEFLPVWDQMLASTSQADGPSTGGSGPAPPPIP